jgi:ABC-type multidrug transport system ATPase subunit/pSer/pThr/pTyr-binding forkhead associated (FHA) protein
MQPAPNHDETAITSAPKMPEGPAAYLVSLSPALVHREYKVAAEGVKVGREAAACDVVVSGATISRQHFRVFPRDGGQFVLQDLNSTNGVFVNRQRVIREALLKEGDLIGIGTAQCDHLRFQRESGLGRPWTVKIPPKPAWTIGRAPTNDIAVSFDATVSSLHAVVRRKGDRVEVADHGSLNGTWLNGAKVRKAALEPADTVTIGSTALRFQVLPDGALQVIRRDCGDEIALECVGLTREVAARGYGITAARTKTILDRVCLAIRPGEFVGLLGPSGAGKSTLLTALNGCQPPSYGCVLLNETPLYQAYAMFRSAIGYVPQDDIVHADLTVEDCLNYVARLRLPPDVSREHRKELIDSTIETLGLNHVRRNRVHELSGGQRKRVSIGCELITRPSILFLDEPTSGMDPSTEERLMRHFQGMARHGTTVLITTHILYNLGLLDRVVILARGRLVFFGRPEEAMQFFTFNDQPIERPTQIFETLEGEGAPSEVQVSGDPKDAVAEHYEQKYLRSELFRRHVTDSFSELSKALLDIATRKVGLQGREAPSRAPTAPGSPPAKRYAALLEHPTGHVRRLGFRLDLFSPRAFLTLTQRQFAVKLVSVKRALFYLAVPLVLALVTLSLRTAAIPEDAAVQEMKTGIWRQIHGGPVDLGNPIKELLAPGGLADPRPGEDVVFALKHEGLANLPTPLSVLLMFVMTAVFMGTLMACLDLSPERPIYLRERMANQKIADYLGSKLPFLLSVTALQCAVFLALCYAKPGLRQFDVAGAYLAMLAMAWTACAMGLLVSAVDPTAGQFSVILAIVAVLPQLVFSGGLGPDFYQGMSFMMKGFAGLFPARWGLEMLITAFYRHPEHASLQWIQSFVPDTIGFAFGPRVYWIDTLILLAQAVVWLVLCGLAVKRLDRVR